MNRPGIGIATAAACFLTGVSVFFAWGLLRYGSAVKVAPVYIPPSFLPPSTPIARPSLAQTASASEIRQVDFLNFKYPNLSRHYRKYGPHLTLKEGEFEFDGPDGLMWLVDLEPEAIFYADVTGDGSEDAVISLFSKSAPSGAEVLLYVYTVSGGRARLLWFFETYGSGSDPGGLKDMFLHEGDLVLELNGENKILEGRAELTNGALSDSCCPTHFTRARFHWDGRRFKQQGRPEIYSLPNGQH